MSISKSMVVESANVTAVVMFSVDVMVNEYRVLVMVIFFFSSRRRHTRLQGDWSSDVCSSDLGIVHDQERRVRRLKVTHDRPDRRDVFAVAVEPEKRGGRLCRLWRMVEAPLDRKSVV